MTLRSVAAVLWAFTAVIVVNAWLYGPMSALAWAVVLVPSCIVFTVAAAWRTSYERWWYVGLTVFALLVIALVNVAALTGNEGVVFATIFGGVAAGMSVSVVASSRRAGDDW